MSDGNSRPWSTKLGELIAEGQRKLSFFYLGEMGKGKDLVRCAHRFPFRNRRAMASELGLSEAQLKGAKDDCNRFSAATIEALGKYLGFNTTWSEWICGTPREFALKYNNENRFDEAPPFPGLKENDTTSEEFIAVPLDVESADDWQYDDQLAAVQLKAVQAGEGRSSISCELKCQMSDLANMRVYVRRGKVSLNLGNGVFEGVGAIEPPIGAPASNIPARISMTRGGSDRKPSWSVEVAEGVIGEIDVPAPVMHIARLSPGITLKAVFSTYLKEITTASKSQSDGIVQEGCKPLGRAKQVVLELLAAHRLPDGDGGHVKLATASLCFKRKA